MQSNILLNDAYTVQINDFGISTIPGSATVTLGPQTGFSAHWASPEFLNTEFSRPTKLCDAYSFGCFGTEVCAFSAYR